MKAKIRESRRGDRRIIVSGESFAADYVCTFQIHARERVRGRLTPMGSKSITVENVLLAEGLKIVRLGVEAFKAARIHP